MFNILQLGQKVVSGQLPKRERVFREIIRYLISDTDRKAGISLRRYAASRKAYQRGLIARAVATGHSGE